MGVRAVLQRESTRRHRFAARDQRPTRPPEDPLGDLPKVVEKMSAIEEDAVPRLIAQKARLVTAATGAAIALGAREEFFCRAIAGDKAPPVGARIRSDSGLTGECLRRRVTLRCDDAEKDERVDAEACRELHVRSIAVVPIRLGSEIAGVVEVFSHHVSAFSNVHVAVLERVADLVAAVCHRTATLIVEAASGHGVAQAGFPGSAASAPALSTRTREDVREKFNEFAADAVAYSRDAAAAVRPHLAVLRRTTNSWMLAALASLFILLAGLGYFVGRARSRAAAVESMLPVPESSAPAVQPTRTSETGEAFSQIGAAVAQKPSAAEKKPSATVPVTPPPAEEPVVLTVSPGSRVPQPRRAEPDVAPPPDVNKISGTTSTGVETAILSAAVVAPKLLPPPKPLVVSQGVIPGRLIKKINPGYPVQAREARLHGVVVLEVAIEKTGKIGKVRVISGHPLLAQSAVQAVKGWIYEPFRLNGEPVDAETQVTVNFSD
jgi:TonB family protein